MHYGIYTPNFGAETTPTLLTWWLETLFRWRNSIEGMRQHIRQGPPRFD